ncbi:MAG: carbohydrate ABC transporter permease [Lachnospiraceae bacterium]|nr:carbohydrate ABC transporter permease [Lachnospiraceae bacterium]
MKKTGHRTSIRESRQDAVFNVINVVVMVIVLVAILYPLYFIVIASISSPNAVNGGRVLLYPQDITFSGYKRILEYEPIWRGYLNSLFYTVAGTLLNLAVTLPAGYALSRKHLFARRPLLLLFAFTMFFSGGMIPTYMVVKNLGLLNTVWAMLLPGACSVYNIIVTKTFMEMNIPAELLDASRIDGCTDFTTFFNVVLPLSRPIIAVMTMFYAVGHWNSYFDALIYLDDEKLFPLQLVLRELLLQSQVSGAMTSGGMSSIAERAVIAEQMKYGVIIVACIPMMIMFPFVIKHFKKGVMIGSIKG